MNAFIYQAALYCEKCISAYDKPQRAGDDDPSGPYPDGGGEADCPQYCDACGLFLENSLTSDGVNYVKQLIAEHRATGRGKKEVLTELADFYGIES